MKRGDLRHKLQIQQVAEAEDSFGDTVETWTKYLDVSGSLKPLRGRELFLAQQINIEAFAEATIDYRAGLNEKMRIVYDGVIYNILHLGNRDMLNTELNILLSRGLDA